MMAVTQIRQPDSPGRGYYERKRLEGKTPKEALRCLKRRLSDVVFRQLVADRASTINPCGSPTTATPTRPTSTSPTAALDSGRDTVIAAAPDGVEGIRRPSTGKTAASSESKSSTPDERLHPDLLEQAEDTRASRSRPPH